MKTVIMAGGKGTRISSVARDIPKPMIPIGDKPVLEHEIECLRRQGFTEIIITVGHLGKVIMDYFGDGSAVSPVTGQPFGVHIQYFAEDQPLGNAGALLKLKDSLDEDFLLLNADVMFDVDFSRLIRFHRSRNADATLFVHPNSHPYDSALIITDDNGRVMRWLHKEESRPSCYRNCVNAGIHVLSRRALEKTVAADRVDLDRDILKPLVGEGRVYAYQSPEYVRDMGTPERYEAVLRDYAAGIIADRNLSRPQRAIFLDRDGTINRHVGFLRHVDELELLPGAGEAIRRINQSAYLAIVVTNQPVVARGEVTLAELREIHSKMETVLGQEGAYLDAIYYCPHHPDSGFEGEVKALKIDCACRKPKPGMLLRAAADYHIDLSRSWMVGDQDSDAQAGRAAGCRTITLADQESGSNGPKGLLEAIESILEGDAQR